MDVKNSLFGEAAPPGESGGVLGKSGGLHRWSLNWTRLREKLMNSQLPGWDLSFKL